MTVSDSGGAMISPVVVQHRRRNVVAGLLILAMVIAAAALLPDGKAQAIHGDVEALGSAAQVRIFAGSQELSGTLVDRHWILTADHGHLEGVTGAYAIFGQVNNASDADPANRRTIDRIVPHPNRVDLAMVHLTEAVPEGTFIPELATTEPQRYAQAHSYGWDGGVLGRLRTTILRPSALDAFTNLRASHPELVEGFTSDVPPMTTNFLLDPGDSGGGTFSPWNVLTGIHVADMAFVYDNENGSTTRQFLATFEQPIWRYRDWIQSVIQGQDQPMPTDQPTSGGPGRQLLDATPNGQLPMSLPPQSPHCDPGASCTVSDPAWVLGFLPGTGNYRGTALAKCAPADGKSCSLDGTSYAAGASARLPLGPSAAKNAPGTREVMLWCQTTTAFPDANSPTRPVVEVSFTNGDKVASPLGYGWWYVTPDQVATGSGNPPVDTGPLAAC